ncbi:hypothetical protein JTE90_004544 [Oedothorax gibbosus]|uniref:C2H2-type domain-containing protein n=1 Tax=Oedothorax gibbosus TaxID=931172 RepID=A0AAV6VDQ1_9ARAC|nr:hypothetical protein JTE90_004544 [Oedothorax gibbosus]
MCTLGRSSVWNTTTFSTQPTSFSSTFRSSESSFKLPFCNICSQSSQLCKHSQKIPQEPAFQCHVCHKTFNRKDNLKVHYRKHSGERPFKCSICDKGFYTKQNMRMHMIRHSGIVKSFV